MESQRRGGRAAGEQGEETPPDLDPSHPGFNLPDLDDLGLGSDVPVTSSPRGERAVPPPQQPPSAPQSNPWLQRGLGTPGPPGTQTPVSSVEVQCPGPDAVYGAAGGGIDLWERGKAVSNAGSAAAGAAGAAGAAEAAGVVGAAGGGLGPGSFALGSHAAGLLQANPPRERPLCQYYMLGQCFRGENCPHVHGLQCHSCGRFCLHPSRHIERAAHLIACIQSQKRARAASESATVECCICLERVMEKANPAARRFGLLACHHAFCLGCIRNWRSQNTSGMDVDAALRTCPVCRSTAHFVTPSPVWVTDPVEKDAIVERYKLKLKTIDCKHFAHGDGTCPFGTSCFYRHQYRDGTLEEVTLRKLGTADGTVRVAKTVRLSDFLFPDLGH